MVPAPREYEELLYAVYMARYSSAARSLSLQLAYIFTWQFTGCTAVAPHVHGTVILVQPDPRSGGCCSLSCRVVLQYHVPCRVPH